MPEVGPDVERLRLLEASLAMPRDDSVPSMAQGNEVRGDAAAEGAPECVRARSAAPPDTSCTCESLRGAGGLGVRQVAALQHV